jgi:hypothetical protein
LIDPRSGLFTPERRAIRRRGASDGSGAGLDAAMTKNAPLQHFHFSHRAVLIRYIAVIRIWLIEIPGFTFRPLLHGGGNT